MAFRLKLLLTATSLLLGAGIVLYLRCLTTAYMDGGILD